MDELLAFVNSEKKVCPQPQKWNELWEMLPDKKRKGLGWEPPTPLILAAWWETTDAQKRERLEQHIKYAAEKGALEKVEAYLRALSLTDWVHEGEV